MFLAVTDSSRKRRRERGPSGRFSSLIPVLEEFLLKDQEIRCSRVCFSLFLCGEDKIRRLNRQYREIDSPTDVLAFPLHEDLHKGPSHPLLNLGDVFICRPVVSRQARQFGREVDEEYIHLLIHGFLHLCGMDHMKKKQAREMAAWERTLKKRMGG